MRVAELSRRSGVTIPTIKFYLREGLLPAGRPTGPNQAEYDERHLHRLRLIRALREVGGLSVAAAAEVTAALDGPVSAVHTLMGRAHHAVIRPSPHDADNPAWQQARAEAMRWVDDLGWRVDPAAPGLDQLADLTVTLRHLGEDQLLDLLPHYAQAALTVAEPEVAAAADRQDPADVMAAVVTGTVLGERLLATVRLLAHEHISATRGAARIGDGQGCQ